MCDQVIDFMIRGHEKVIAHYGALLSYGGLSNSERIAIEERLRKEEASLRILVQTGEAA